MLNFGFRQDTWQQSKKNEKSCLFGVKNGERVQCEVMGLSISQTILYEEAEQEVWHIPKPLYFEFPPIHPYTCPLNIDHCLAVRHVCIIFVFFYFTFGPCLMGSFTIKCGGVLVCIFMHLYNCIITVYWTSGP